MSEVCLCTCNFYELCLSLFQLHLTVHFIFIHFFRGNDCNYIMLHIIIELSIPQIKFKRSAKLRKSKVLYAVNNIHYGTFDLEMSQDLNVHVQQNTGDIKQFSFF